MNGTFCKSNDHHEQYTNRTNSAPAHNRRGCFVRQGPYLRTRRNCCCRRADGNCSNGSLLVDKKECIMIKWFAFMALISLCFIFTACAHFQGKETIKNESVTIKDLPDVVEGLDLVQITTETGHIVEVLRDSIPKDENGNPYWPMVKVDPNEQLKGASDGVSMIPGYGTLIGGSISALLAFTTLNQRKQKQAEIDRRQKEEGKVRLREKLLIAAASAIEIGTTDGTIKGIAKKIMTKEDQKVFDEITEPDRVKIAANKLAAEAVKAS